MSGPTPPVAAARVAVRRVLESSPAAERGEQPLTLVACSGGPDSLALAAATAFVAPRSGWRAGAVIVDHGLQDGSNEVAAQAAEACTRLGLAPVVIRTATVSSSASGPEANARQARYEALEAVAAETGASLLLVGHTRDDQAEQVLLGLSRGSGTRALAGMPTIRSLAGASRCHLARPFLTITRQQSHQVCADLALEPWRDPHNLDRSFARVRARQVLPQLEQDLGPGLSAALARSARQLADDADALDDLARQAHQELGVMPWEASELAVLAPAIRRRVWRIAALDHGVPAAALAFVHLQAIDDLIGSWRGQGPVWLPGGIQVLRAKSLVWIQTGDGAAGADQGL